MVMRKILMHGLLVMAIATGSFSMGMAWFNFNKEMGCAPFFDVSVRLKITVPQYNPGLFQNSLSTASGQTTR